MLSLSDEVQALDDAESTSNGRISRFPASLDKVDETVQRVEGVLVIDAKSIYDSMYGASGPSAMEENRTAVEMMEIQEGMRRQNEIVSWRSKPQRWIDQGNGKNAAGTLL